MLSSAAEAQPPDVAWLGDAESMRSQSGGVRIKALQLTQLLASDRERAVKCHDFVRRTALRIGPWSSRPVEQVLLSRSATALEKTDLLVALLRSCSIAARLRIYSIKANHLQGLVSDPNQLTMHPVLEASIGSKWLQVDTHHLDIRLSLGARSRLACEGVRQGYGVNLDGAVSWEGWSDAHAIPMDAAALHLRDWGVFHDAAEFCEHCEEVCECLGSRGTPFRALLLSAKLHQVRTFVGPG